MWDGLAENRIEPIYLPTMAFTHKTMNYEPISKTEFAFSDFLFILESNDETESTQSNDKILLAFDIFQHFCVLKRKFFVHFVRL